MGRLRAVLLTESVLLLVLLLPAIPPAMAAVARAYAGDPDHPGTCYIGEVDARVKAGTTVQIPGCATATCSGTGYDMMIYYVSCGVVGASPPCFTTQDERQPYPACCVQVHCPRRTTYQS